jgi:hypothetical protein
MTFRSSRLEFLTEAFISAPMKSNWKSQVINNGNVETVFGSLCGVLVIRLRSFVLRYALYCQHSFAIIIYQTTVKKGWLKATDTGLSAPLPRNTIHQQSAVSPSTLSNAPSILLVIRIYAYQFFTYA